MERSTKQEHRMEAEEIVQSVISGCFDLRKQQIQEVSHPNEDNQNFACSGQSSIRHHKILEGPFRHDPNSSCGTAESKCSAGQQNQRHQSKLQEIPLHAGDRQNTGPSGQNPGSKGQQDRKQQPKFQKVPQTSGQQQDTPSFSTNPYAALVDCLRATWLTGKTRPMEYRKTQLEALGRFLEENETEILHALSVDMHRPPFEGQIADVSLVKNEVNQALNNLSSWMKDECVDKSLATKLDCAFVRKDPYGVVLIISPFNYPIQLTVVPMVGAIAAGNCVIIKPSEQSSCSEKLLAEVLPSYLDPDTFAVVTGGSEPTTKLLENKFDYIMFTGSPPVGKIVMSAAAKHLTPLTLELGGQNPCYVDCCCHFQNAANRIVWAKFFNTGQTCIAPDYVICTIETQERLMPCLRQAIREFYGCNPRDSPDYGRMINDKHFRRVCALLDSGRVAIGGETDECDRYIGVRQVFWNMLWILQISNGLTWANKSHSHPPTGTMLPIVIKIHWMPSHMNSIGVAKSVCCSQNKKYLLPPTSPPNLFEAVGLCFEWFGDIFFFKPDNVGSITTSLWGEIWK